MEVIVKGGKNIVISCIYRTPGSEFEPFIDHIENVLKQINTSKSIYLCGDFNIDVLKSAAHNFSKSFFDLLYSYGMFPMIDKPTRVTSYSATLIDNIFTNCFSNNSRSGILYNDITDHLPIFSSCAHKGISKTKVERFKYIRSVSNTNRENFKVDLCKVQWECVLEETNINAAYDAFIGVVV